MGLVQNGLVYRNIEKILLARFPELKEPMDRAFGSYYKLDVETPEAYPVFEDALQRYLLGLLEFGGDDPFLPEIFSFFEEMARSDDKEVTNLLWIAILEPLTFQPEKIARAWRYMGPQTKELARKVARAGGWAGNLPRD